MSSPDDSVILAQLRNDVAAWEREATKHHPERAALYATIALAKWLRSVARRAEVAGLVATLDRAVDVMADPASDYAYDNARDKFAAARDRLARLAEGA